MSKSQKSLGDERRLTDTDDVLERAEAEAAEAEALAVAAQARARAARLRAEAPTASSETDSVTDAAGDADRADELPKADGRRLRPRLRALSAALALLCSVAMLVLSGYIIWTHHAAAQERSIRAEYAAAAKQAVVTLMSIDFNDPQSGVQRIIDNSADPFRAEFEGAADDFVKVASDAKVTTKATANAAAVQSVTADSAVVLVSASSTVTNAAGAQEAPRSWRLTVDLKREGDQIKMSKVEFVP